MVLTQITAMQNMIYTLARMETPFDGVAAKDRENVILADLPKEELVDAAAILYSIIEEAREVLAMNKRGASL